MSDSEQSASSSHDPSARTGLFKRRQRYAPPNNQSSSHDFLSDRTAEEMHVFEDLLGNDYVPMKERGELILERYYMRQSIRTIGTMCLSSVDVFIGGPLRAANRHPVILSIGLLAASLGISLVSHHTSTQRHNARMAEYERRISAQTDSIYYWEEPSTTLSNAEVQRIIMQTSDTEHGETTTGTTDNNPAVDGPHP